MNTLKEEVKEGILEKRFADSDTLSKEDFYLHLLWDDVDGELKEELEKIANLIIDHTLSQVDEVLEGKKVIGMTADECKCCTARNKALSDAQSAIKLIK